MTENEAIKFMVLFRNEWDVNSKTKNAKALDMAIKALEEIKALKVENAELHCEIQAINATMDLLENEIRNKAIDEFASTLIPRLTDAIYPQDVASMTNLINDVVEELKEGAE